MNIVSISSNNITIMEKTSFKKIIKDINHMLLNGRYLHIHEHGCVDIYSVLSYIVKSYTLYDDDDISYKSFNNEINFYYWLSLSDPDIKIPIIRLVTFYVYKTSNNLIFDNFIYDSYSIIEMKDTSKRIKSIKCFIKRILTCLEFLHDNDYVHCDIKPSNIVCSNEELTEFYLIDFGNCYKFDELSKINTNVTTKEYISPEQYTNSKINKSTDIYSLGISIIELIQYETFENELIKLKKYGNFNNDLINTNINNLDDLVSKMLIKDPLERISAKNALEHDYFK